MLRLKIGKELYNKNCLLKTFTARCELGWILWLCWCVDVPMNVLAVVIEGVTGIHWWIVMLKAFIWVPWYPKDIDHQ